MKELFIKKGVPVIITEFGCTDKDNLDSRIEWIEFYKEQADSVGIPCVWWDNGFFTESIVVKYQQQGPWCPLNRYYSQNSGRSMEDVFVLPPVIETTRKDQGEREEKPKGNRDQENTVVTARKVRE